MATNKVLLQAHVTPRQHEVLRKQAKAKQLTVAEVLRQVLDEKFPAQLAK